MQRGAVHRQLSFLGHCALDHYLVPSAQMCSGLAAHNVQEILRLVSSYERRCLIRLSIRCEKWIQMQLLVARPLSYTKPSQAQQVTHRRADKMLAKERKVQPRGSCQILGQN